ncbi:penicillin acylase family protein [Parvularcula sp. IMCC14364]|uniref:penicillin acylase family protein n=1 Tax=Parvularcula sp. IMCC14364 TaxID=3067902 RepID=UPI0027410510|nr:penicillin acylase family protein [Parvularcula sp. IMCC14364]
MKKLFSGVLVLVIIAAVAAGFWLWTPQAQMPDLSAYKAKAETYDVRIVRDKWGVPHIFGARDPDASFGLAYAHAEDDWQTIQETLMFRKGVLAKHIGQDGAITDYLVQLLKADQVMDARYESDLKLATREMIEAYADGINLWAAENPDAVKPELLPVTGQDIVAGFFLRTPFFFGLDDELQELFKDAPQYDVSEKELASFLNDDVPGGAIGSNAFAVAPSRSDDGHTRLLVNSHQPYTGPVAWYEARLKTQTGWDIIGGLFPGTPFPTVGTNQHLGWAHTVNKPDLLDIYALTVDDLKKPRQYMLDGTWQDFEVSKAKFRVKLFGPFSLPVTRDILWSEHGPVLVTSHGAYAFRYAGMDNIRAVEQWYEMGRAENFAQWETAMRSQGVPSFNTVYADKEGNIAYYYNAVMPKRADGWNWRQYLPGDTSEVIWDTFHDFEALPHTVNPPSGWVFNTNNTPYQATGSAYHLSETDYPASFGIETNMNNRAMRSLEQYEPDDIISEADFLAYREDIFYSQNSEAMEVAREIAAMDFSGDAELEAGQKILGNWDGSTQIENRNAALSILTASRANDFLMGDDVMTREAAFRSAVADINTVYGRLDPTWGELSKLERGDTLLPLAGGPDVLRAVYYHDTLLEKGYLTAMAGDTYILYADWDPEGNLEVQTIHQFGSATIDETSPHYDDQAPLFAELEYKPMPLTLEEVLSEATRDYRPGR